MGFTHADTGIATSTGSNLTVTLSGAVSKGDLIIIGIEASTTPRPSDSAGNIYTILGPFATSDYLGWCVSTVAAGGGITITSTANGDCSILIADRFTVSGGSAVLSGSAFTTTGDTGGLNSSSSYNMGDLGTVPAGTLVYGAAFSNSNAGNQAYTAGNQTGSSGTANVIGSQAASAGNARTAFSAYVTSSANTDAAMTWHGTGTASTLIAAASVYFTLTSSVYVVQAAVATSGSPVTLNAATTAGNTILLGITDYSGGSAMSTSAVKLGGSTVTGTTLLLSANSPNVGGNQGYFGIWELPAIPSGQTSITWSVSGAAATLGAMALEVAGLGMTPVLDKTASGVSPGAGSSALDTGSSGAISHPAEIIFAMSQTVAGVTGSGAQGLQNVPWSWYQANNNHSYGGWQIAQASGGSYDWAITVGAGSAWAAGLVTVAVTATPGSALIAASII